MTTLPAAHPCALRQAPIQTAGASAGQGTFVAREQKRAACTQATLDALHRATIAASTALPRPAPDAPLPSGTPAASPVPPASPKRPKSSKSPTTPQDRRPHRRRVLPACVHAAQRAWELARTLGANTLGALAGVLTWMRPFDADDAPDAPGGPLWDLFAWTEQSQSESRYGDWLRLNGFAETPDGRMALEQTVAWEITQARRAGAPVTLQDHNLTLLHPFAYSDEEIFTAYLCQMSHDGTYGSGSEARALAEALQVRIVAYRPVQHSNGQATVALRIVYGDADAEHTLHIQHDGGAHWEGVQRPQGTPDAQPLGIDDTILTTGADGNCLFHAVAAALHATQHPHAKHLEHDFLRALAVEQMHDHAVQHMPHVRLEVDDARGDMDPAQADLIDARAVRAVWRAHLHLPWDATWKYLVAHIDDVQSFNGVLTPNATSHAMDRLFNNFLQRLGQVVQSQNTSPHSFLQSLTDIGASCNQGLERTLGALSMRQRRQLLDIFPPPVGLTLAEAEATYGALFASLALSDKLALIGSEQTSTLVARLLQSSQGRLEALSWLSQELDATLLDLDAQRPLTRAQWAAHFADPAVLQGARAAMSALCALPVQEHQGKWQALYRLVNAAAPSVRDAFLQGVLRESPQAFADLGRVLNRHIPGNLPRDVRRQQANRAAVDVLFDCLARG